MAKIGIPRVLWYYQNWFLWEAFFSELGLEVVVSKKTDAKILEDSLRLAEEEICLPAKIALGHIIFLRGKVDYIFLPHIVSWVKGFYCCPKFIGLPDVARNTLSDIPPLIEPVIDLTKEKLYPALFKIGLHFSKNPFKIFKAIREATPDVQNKTKQTEESNIKLALISHPYITKDNFINMNIGEKLREMDASLYDVNDLPEDILGCRPADMQSLNWDFVKRLHSGLLYFLKNGVDGVINIVSFGCGPDSLSSEMFTRLAHLHKKPFLQLNIDAQSQESGFDTRLETFVEMIRRKKR